MAKKDGVLPWRRCLYETTGGYIRPSRPSPYFVHNQGKRVRNEVRIFELWVKSRVGVHKESEDVLERKINKTCGTVGG